MTQKTRVVGYVRVSTEKQVEKGLSLDAQEAKIRDYAALYELHIVKIVRDEGQSGRDLDRPGLTAALTMLRKGEADALVVAKLDRLTRRVVNLGELVEEYFNNKAALLSVSESIDTRSASGRLVLNVLTSVAQWEREAIAERTSEALRHKASIGEFTGGEPPFGFKRSADGRRVEPVDSEQRIIETAVKLRRSRLSLRAISRTLQERGMKSRNGAAFAPTQLARLIRAAQARTSET